MAISAGAQAALLKWVNTFPLSAPVPSIEALADGHALSQVLSHLDPSFSTSDLDYNAGASAWLTRKRNLQAITRGLVKFMRREAPECVELAQTDEIRAVPEKADDQALAHLVTVFVAAAFLSSNEELQSRSITGLQKNLSEEEQREMAGILQQKQTEIQEASALASNDDTIERIGGGRDAALEAEEEALRMAADLESKKTDLEGLQYRHADLKTRFDYLQESHDELKEKLKSTEEELEGQKRLNSTDESARTRALQRKVDESANVIAALEEQLEAQQLQNQSQTVELERLQTATKDAQEHKDKYDELAHQFKDLERRANAADRYKQKLTSQRDVEKELAAAQYELESKKDVDSQLQRVLKEKARLEATQAELMSVMGNNETSLYEERDQKDRLKVMLEEAKTQLQAELHNRTINEKYIEDLREQLGANGGAISSTDSPVGLTGPSLEDELDSGSGDRAVALNLQISRLQGENNLLRSSMGTGSQMDELRAELERTKTERDIAASNQSTVLEKWAIAQEQIKVLIDNIKGEESVKAIEAADRRGELHILSSDFYRHVVLQNTRTRLAKVESEYDAASKHNRTLEEQLSDAKREVVKVTGECEALMRMWHTDNENADTETAADNAIGKDSIDALEALKQSDQLISGSLRSELDALRKKYTILEAETSMTKNQLLDALVAKDKLSRGAEAAADSTAAALVAPSTPTASVSGDEAAREERFKSQGEKLTKLREHVTRIRKQLEEREQEKLELARKVKAFESGSALAEVKTSYEQQIETLERSSRLITSAFYDLKRSVQVNFITLQRREQPKSWLGKAREQVNGPPRR